VRHHIITLKLIEQKLTQTYAKYYIGINIELTNK
jgi:hypothetical protein